MLNNQELLRTIIDHTIDTLVEYTYEENVEYIQELVEEFYNIKITIEEARQIYNEIYE
ncbi:MAG: hypothetical protein ACRC1P_09830 [Cellulosilyticaceae bacterium]